MAAARAQRRWDLKHPSGFEDSDELPDILEKSKDEVSVISRANYQRITGTAGAEKGATDVAALSDGGSGAVVTSSSVTGAGKRDEAMGGHVPSSHEVTKTEQKTVSGAHSEAYPP